MRALLFSVISIGSPSPCKSLQEIAIGAVQNKLEPEDVVNFVLDGPELPLKIVGALVESVDYLLYHKILWARIKSGNRLCDSFQKGLAIYEVIRQHSTHSIREFELAIALGTDMRMALHLGARPETGIKSVVEHFDYPSLFLLFMENQPGVAEYENVLETLLDEKLLDFFRDATSIFDIEVMNALSTKIGCMRVYERLSQFDAGAADCINHLNYYALRKLMDYAFMEDKDTYSFDVAASRFTSLTVDGLMNQFDPNMVHSKQGARQVMLLLRLSGSLQVPVEILLRLNSNVRRWLRLGSFEPIALKHHLLVSNHYLTKEYLVEDLHFLDERVVEIVGSRIFGDMEGVFSSQRTVRFLCDVLSGQNREKQYQLLHFRGFHHLYQMMRANDNHDLGTLLNSLLEKRFPVWFYRPFRAFGPTFRVLSNPRWAQDVAQRMLHHPKEFLLCRLDYISALLLKEAFISLRGTNDAKIEYYLDTIVEKLSARRTAFYEKLAGGALVYLAKGDFMEKLVYMLPRLPEPPIAIDKMISFFTSGYMTRTHVSSTYVGHINKLFRRALQSMPAVQAFLNIERNLRVFPALFLLFERYQEFQDTMHQLNYNHVLVLRNAYRHLHLADKLLRNDVGAYCHELLPEYVFSDRRRTVPLEELQYLALCRLKQESWLKQEIAQAINSGLANANLRWRHWFAKRSGDVLGDKENTKELINALEYVPKEEYLFTPLQLLQLEASVEGFKMEAAKAHRQFEKHEKLFFSEVNPATKHWSPSELFRRHIWQDEGAVDVDKKLSVWFDGSVKIDKRVAVSGKISWPAVQAYKDECLKSGKRWHPPNGLWKQNDKFQFLLDDDVGLPMDWF